MISLFSIPYMVTAYMKMKTSYCGRRLYYERVCIPFKKGKQEHLHKHYVTQCHRAQMEIWHKKRLQTSRINYSLTSSCKI